MTHFLDLKCPKCGAALSKNPGGGYFCEYCDSKFTSEAEVAGNIVYEIEKGKIRSEEEKEENSRREGTDEENSPERVDRRWSGSSGVCYALS